jgi:hypothetical protein
MNVLQVYANENGTLRRIVLNGVEIELQRGIDRVHVKRDVSVRLGGPGLRQALAVEAKANERYDVAWDNATVTLTLHGVRVVNMKAGELDVTPEAARELPYIPEE